MVEIICEFCGEPFLGRPNRKTCSVPCRRTLEGKRRHWDRQMGHVKFCEQNAEWDWLTPVERKNWQKKADVLREKQMKHWGPRP
jgi:hypothetical protein